MYNSNNKKEAVSWRSDRAWEKLEESWKALEEEKKGEMLQFYLNYNLKSICLLVVNSRKVRWIMIRSRESAGY